MISDKKSVDNQIYRVYNVPTSTKKGGVIMDRITQEAAQLSALLVQLNESSLKNVIAFVAGVVAGQKCGGAQ